MTSLRSLHARIIAGVQSPHTQKRIRKGIWGIADQGLMSATTFVMMVLLARVLHEDGFGHYALTYTGLLFMNSIQSAIITRPHTMLGAVRTKEDFARYTTGTLLFQMGFGLLSGLIAVGLALLARAMDWDTAPLFLACAPASLAWQVQEYVRRVLYTQSRVSSAFFNDVIAYGGQLVLLVGLWWNGTLTVESAMVALAATSAAGAIFGLWQIRGALDWSHPRRDTREAFVANWNFGKWLLGGTAAQWSSARVYPILAAGLVSIAATGAMKVVQTILGPTHIIKFSLDPLMGPNAARTYKNKGPKALRAFTWRTQWLLIATIGGYSLFVSIFAAPILDIVFDHRYVKYDWLLQVMALTNLLSSLRTPQELALSAVGETSTLFRIRVLSALLNLTIGLAAVHMFGLPGVAVGLIGNAIFLQFVTAHYYQLYTDSISWLSRIRNGQKARPTAPAKAP